MLKILDSGVHIRAMPRGGIKFLRVNPAVCFDVLLLLVFLNKFLAMGAADAEIKVPSVVAIKDRSFQPRVSQNSAFGISPVDF